MSWLVAVMEQHRLAPDPRGGRVCARPGGAGRAQAGSQANRQGDRLFADLECGAGRVSRSVVPGLTRDLRMDQEAPDQVRGGCAL